MIERWFTKSFTVDKKQWVEDADGWHTQSDTDTTFNGHLQQADQEKVEQFNLATSKAYSIWCGLDVDISDQEIITHDSNTYTVRGVIDYDNGQNPHKELIVEKDD